MDNEKNLDDILKLLQESVENLDDSEALSDGGEPADAMLSTEDLQKKLEERYFSDGASGTHETDGTYELDSDFLAEFSVGEDDASPDEDDVTEDTEDIEIIEEETEDIEIIEEETEETDELDDLAELCELENCMLEVPMAAEPEKEEYSSPVLTLELEESTETENIASDTSRAPWESPEVADTVETEEGELPETTLAVETVDAIAVTDVLDDTLFEDTDDGEYDVIDRQTDIDGELTETAEALSEESEKTEEDSENIFNEFTSYPKEKQTSFKSIMMDYGRPDPTPSPRVTEDMPDPEETVEDETPDVGDILSDFADVAPTEEERIDSSVRMLMTSLGCEDELEGVSAEEIGELYGQFTEGGIQPEPTVENTVEHNRSEYKKNIMIASLKLAACAVMTLIMFLYDTLPLFDVEFAGLADYVLYPSAYVMIGTQLLLICAAFMWRSLWGGIKRLLTVTPDMYSMVFVTVCFNGAYDMILFITGGYSPLQTPVFHFVCGAVLTGIAVYELQMRIREAVAFNIYSADVGKFTLTCDKAKHSIGEKMYSGGFSKEKRVYSPSPVSSPKGFFESIRDTEGFGNKVFSSLIFASVGVSVLLGLALMIAGRSLEHSAATAITAGMALLPVTAVSAILMPLSISSSRLKRRGIALTGRRKIRKYGKENALVFSDLHLFSKCDPKQVGFVCYEKLQTKNILGAMNILYSRIDGPMGRAFADIPNDCKAKSIRVRRITRSGIEAVVDKSHTLIVGDLEFLGRYGIEFPRTEVSKKMEKNATLYISLDGRASAKLTAVYNIEPLFDMLIERLSAEGIHCVIETYDPMINTRFVAKQRKKGRAPISVVHKNAADINRPVSHANKSSDHGILALSSRLKLAEAVVWCARLCKIEKLTDIIIYVSVGISFAAVLLLTVLGVLPCFMQYLLLAYFLLVGAVVLAVTFGLIPRKNYFSVSALDAEDAEKEENIKKQEERKNK